MCGIFSIISKKGEFISDTSTIAVNVQKALRHRGPENSSFEILDNKLLLLHNRLSIIDLNRRANQPLWDQTGAHIITFNGEIYNYKELKEQRLKDYRFKTVSDTEVVLNLYDKYGEESFDMLDGIFATVLYDKKKDIVYVVRDKAGKKPLYIYEDHDNIYVSSEIKAFYHIPGFEPQLNYFHIDYVFSFFHTPDLSPFTNVRMLEPGSYIIYSFNGTQLEKRKINYFSVLQLVNKDQYLLNLQKSEASVLEEFEHLLLKAVEKRLIADVPVVSTNSGGLDSSLVSAIAAKFNKNIKLFHVDVDGNSEKYYADILARHLKAELISCSYNETLFNEYFKAASQAYEYFMIHPNSVALYALAKEVRARGYKVILAGEAADELSGGYVHLAHYIKNFNRFKTLPEGVVTRIQWLIRKLNKNVLGNHIPGFNENYMNGQQAFLKIHLERELIKNIENNFMHIQNKKNRLHRTMLTYDYLRYLQPLFLRGDKMFMAHSVEMRLPFADIDLLSYCINLPEKYVSNKQILRKIAEKYLPLEIVHRRKKGFPTPYQLKTENKLTIGNININALNVKNKISMHGLKHFLELNNHD